MTEGFDVRDGMAALHALGFGWPSPACIVGAILFGVLGRFAYYYSRSAPS